MTEATTKAKRVELVRRLAELAPKRRLDAMLEELDGAALVRSVAPEEVYAAIIDVGLVDCAEVVQMSTPAQFRAYVDLAAWQRDRVDPLEVLHWLRAARGDDDDEFIRKLQALDIELLELLFKRYTQIHDLEENPDVDVQGVSMETPEGKFLIETPLEGADLAALQRLIRDVMAHNPFELARFLEAVRWELPTELEEAAYQFRSQRLQDLGIPPLEEAMKVYAWLDPEKQAVRPAPKGLTAPQGHVDFVGAAFKGLDEVERVNLESEVRWLVNSFLVAEGAEPGDPQAVRRASERTRDYLDLGFEHLTSGDAGAALEVVREKTLRTVFQVGFSLTLKLKRQMEKMAAEVGARFGDTWLALDEEAAALAALGRRRPLKALKVPGAEPVPFRSRRELLEMEALLARVRRQRVVLGGLLGASPAEVIARFGVSLAELTPQRLFAAVVARAEVDGIVDASPFSELALPALCARLFDEGVPARLRPSAGKRAVEVLSQALPEGKEELEPMVARVLASFLQDFGAAFAKDARVDPLRVTALPLAGR